MDADLLIHPGEVLAEEFMKPYGLSANRLANALDVPANRITAIINGTRGITGETALLLAHAFGTTPAFWLNLQSRYELDVAKSRVSPAAIERADSFRNTLPAA
ncbi:HigA family addiction module antitoxin [Rhodopila globiformis]|uniref:Addiction module antidote protein, HigA family n=1 Tax=Rhodopila globiformis TaxID=1071 RepID=A0A2S6N064_RHOGL|nr:HigA family addiction module antitoxin [Rhodopila globiformis]PPQ28015.1 addiction module antidote protein, HigA family [Rhodopila globiformis]